ncbi:alpha-tubulin N-acetyltransferase 1-like [Physella acuta]|uniref:alpha-tubulin N-acetyltransferase 1-like n=1 Tax=Physella acuta TaxID=109671 RepID=UPI0027DC2949|nr:alpha-tubulin N-acetyltransferase 1-like [Physella acuta]
MDFSFSVNKLLHDEISVVDSTLQLCRANGTDRQNFRQLQSMLYDIVDKMGEASAKAQSLHGPITTGKRLETSGHRVYIMKDNNSNRGMGCVIGILKVGSKKLFVYDNSKKQHEMEPLCVLDFYVHESRQRMGCGRKLFDFMLMNEGIRVEHLAIDRPSPKFLSFLKRHYKLEASIPQVNNFVVFEGFFANRADRGNNRNRRNDGYNRPYSGNQRNQRSNYYESNPAQAYRNSPLSELSVKKAESGFNVPGVYTQSHSHMGAGDMMYSRHGIKTSSRNSAQQYNAFNNQQYSQSESNLNRATVSPQWVHEENMQNRNNEAPSPSEYQSNQNYRPSSGKNTNSIPSATLNQQRVTTPPTVIDPRFPKQMPDNISSTASMLPVITVTGLPPSGKRPFKNENFEPPELRRNEPPASYKELLNLHQQYQGRNGHLSLPPSQTDTYPHVTTPSAPSYAAPALPSNRNTSWTVMGALRDQRLAAPAASRYNPNRLW